MKTLFVIISSICLFGCFSRDFKVIEATSQKWVGGIPGAGKGTNYVIKVIPHKSSDKLHIDKIWIGEEYFDVTALKNPRKVKETSFDKNDTLTIKINHYIRTNMLGEIVKKEIKEENNTPEKFEGDALIGFTYKGKRKYKTLKEFKKLKFIPYP